VIGTAAIESGLTNIVPIGPLVQDVISKRDATKRVFNFGARDPAPFASAAKAA
jgi:hypothetical protein